MSDAFKYVGLFSMIVSFVSLQCYGCTSLRNVTLTAQQRHGSPLIITSFSGCVDGRTFENKTVIEVQLRNQNVINITKDTIRDMEKLETIIIIGCPIEIIVPGAFTSLPLLHDVQIVYGKLLSIPDGVFNIFPTIKHLKVHHNKISSIGENAFSNIPSLMKIYLSNNELKVWRDSWFKNSTNIEYMEFQRNKIEFIPKFAFRGMSKLNYLRFDFNEIEYIGEGAFSDVQNLKYLNLRYNRLNKIDGNIFPEKLRVSSFFINANDLNFLPSDMFQKLTVQEIYFDGNPWKCPCLEKINSWLYASNSTVKTSDGCSKIETPSCLFPQTASTICSENIDPDISRLYKDKMRKTKGLRKDCARID